MAMAAAARAWVQHYRDPDTRDRQDDIGTTTEDTGMGEHQIIAIPADPNLRIQRCIIRAGKASLRQVASFEQDLVCLLYSTCGTY